MLPEITYKHPLWKKKRKKILERDNHKCVSCSSEDNLQVHHTCYRTNLLYWDYPDESLETLCTKCHDRVHTKSINFFYRNVPNCMKTYVPKYTMPKYMWLYKDLLDKNKVIPLAILYFFKKEHTEKPTPLQICQLYWITGFSIKFIKEFYKIKV